MSTTNTLAEAFPKKFQEFRDGFFILVRPLYIGGHDDAVMTSAESAGKRGLVQFAGTAQRVLRTNCTCPLFLALSRERLP